MIYADFESILVVEDNGKQNLEKSHASKYQKHFAGSYGYILVSIDDNFSKPFKSYLSEDAVYNFVNSLIEESKFHTDIMKKHFNKEIMMTKEYDEDFKNSTKCWICDNAYVGGDIKAKGHCHIAGKYGDSPQRYRNINVKLDHKIPIVFHNLKD